MYNRRQKRRLLIVLSAYALFFLLLFFRLTYLQLIKHNELSKLAREEHNLKVDILPQRGHIYDRNLKELAVSLKVDSLYAVPWDIEDKEYTANILSNILGIDREKLLQKLSRGKGFVWLARAVAQGRAMKIRSLKLKGIDFVKEYRRFYPNGMFCAHLLGYAGIDNAGLDGIELYYDKYLKGTAGARYLQRDAKGYALAAFERRYLPAYDGLNLLTTVDEVIQHIVERELDTAMRDSHARAGLVVVMDPNNGDILALANRPAFDPNRFWDSNERQRRNWAICDIFEPGSTFKIVTASAVLNEKAISPATKFFCENGSYFYAGHTLHDHKPHGWLTFKEVIEQSSNIGTCKIAQILGKDRLFKYIKLFGFGHKSGIDLPGEAVGIAKPPRFWSKVSITNVPMGQEVAVTAMQMALAMGAIANGGSLVRPRIAVKIIDNDGQVVYEQQPVIVRRVISQEASAAMREFLRGVVETGTGTLAKVDGYAVAGKTGTAQKLEANGTYSHTKFVASFFGFAPADKPAIVIGVVLDEPHPLYFGGTVSAPVFSRIAKDVLRYKEIPPDRSGLAAAAK